MKDFKRFKIKPYYCSFGIFIKKRKNLFFHEWVPIGELYETRQDAECAVLNMVLDTTGPKDYVYTPKFRIGQSVKFKSPDSISGALLIGIVKRIHIKELDYEPIYYYTIETSEKKMLFNDIKEEELKLC